MNRPLTLPFAAILASSCLALTACGPGENDPGPGGVTVGEARALDDAAAMLDARAPQDAPANGPSAPPDSPSSQPTPSPSAAN